MSELPNLEHVDPVFANNDTIMSDIRHALSLKFSGDPAGSVLRTCAEGLPSADVKKVKEVTGDYELNERHLRAKLAAARLMNRICNNGDCLKKDRLYDLRLCRGCAGSWYCDTECQRKDWHLHRLRCGQADGPLDEGPMALAILRLPPPQKK